MNKTILILLFSITLTLGCFGVGNVELTLNRHSPYLTEDGTVFSFNGYVSNNEKGDWKEFKLILLSSSNIAPVAIKSGRTIYNVTELDFKIPPNNDRRFTFFFEATNPTDLPIDSRASIELYVKDLKQDWKIADTADIWVEIEGR